MHAISGNNESRLDKLWAQWMESKVRRWGGSQGLVIPTAANFELGPVLIENHGNSLKIIKLNIPLPKFKEFVKDKLENGMDDAKRINRLSDEAIEPVLAQFILATKALKQRSLPEFANLLKDPKDERGFFAGAASNLESHITNLMNSELGFNREYLWQRLVNEIQSVLGIME